MPLELHTHSNAEVVQAELVAAAVAASASSRGQDPVQGPSASPPLPNLTLPGGSLDALRVVSIRPTVGHFSRFFGQTATGGEPTLLPSVGTLGTQGHTSGRRAGGAAELSVGDVADIPLEIISMLPQPMELSDLDFTLSILQVNARFDSLQDCRIGSRC